VLNRNKAIHIWVAFILLLAAWAPGPAQAYPVKIKDGRGKMVLIKSRPERIVSLAPSETETLFAIGAGPRVVGVTKFCNYPKAATKLPKVGDMTTNVEAVLALKPDLVVAHSFINPSAVTQLEKLGVTVFAVNPLTIPEVIRDIVTLGDVVGRPRTARKLAGQMRSALNAVRKQRANKPIRKVLSVVQTNPLWAAGPKTFTDEILKLANGRNVAYDARPGFVQFSEELALSRNPDVIIVGTKSDVNYFLTSPKWKTISAARHRRVYYIVGDLLVRPGPRLVQGANEVAQKLDFCVDPTPALTHKGRGSPEAPVAGPGK
jgi:iron complex transport system substrate-binding protein